MNIENIKAFVYYDSNNFISPRLLKMMIFTYAYCDLVFGVFGIVAKGVFLQILLWLLGITLLYVIFVFAFVKLWNQADFSQRFLVNGISSLFMTSYFTVIMFFFVFIESNKQIVSLYAFIIVCGMCICFALVWALTLRDIGKGKYSKKVEKSKNKMRNVSIRLGVMSGILFAESILPRFGLQYLLTAVISMFFILVCCTILGSINFLKYYYVKKFEILEDTQRCHSGTNKSAKKRNKKKVG